jgi:hypothetical protein
MQMLELEHRAHTVTYYADEHGVVDHYCRQRTSLEV